MDPKEEIVVSGISGRFPECNNSDELAEALLNGVDLVTDDERRFPRGVMGIPSRTGKLPELDKFDATFFGIHAKQAEFMDPRHRILCEIVYETIIDAGYNPQELRGSKTGVYTGLAIFGSLESYTQRDDTDGYTNIGLSSAVGANRISYCFDFHGKSYSLDTACSTTVYGFVNAMDDLRSGLIDAAIVCGANVLFHPHESSEFNKLNMLARDGKCKVYSTLRDGYARAEAVACLLLQKRSASRRVYATVVGAVSNADGYKVEGITYPSVEMQVKLLKEIYDNRGVNPDEVNYVEAHGTGTPAGDTQELQALLNTFCKNRKTPLPVGAVKSNLGHSEVSSGLCSVFKVLIAMEKGVIPANLHVEPLDTSLPGIKENKIKVVTKNLPWDGGLAAVNCFGFGGANAHLLFKSNPKEKPEVYKRPKHRLVLVSGRTEEAVNHFLDEVEKNGHDEEFLALVDEIHKMNVEGHNFRGYTILGDAPKREVERYTKPRPIWFIYPGMGCQWVGMGRDMMRNEVFRNTIKKCAQALKPYGVDLEEILTTTDPKISETTNFCFAGIGAMEVALTDVLYSLGIVPDGIAGHSLGEVGCSYADGYITPEQAILLAFARGYALQQVELPPGAMAAVNLSEEECLKILPEGIYIGCVNGKNSVSITGPASAVADFSQQLTSRGIFCKMVNTGGMAYHSKYIADAVPHLYNFVKEVLKPTPPRSTKWLSTSLTDDQKNEPWAQYNCAEYHSNNYANKVLFDKVHQHVPKDAIVVEVAPHGLFQPLLKMDLDTTTVKILSVANRSSPDNEEFFLSAIGKIYLAGGQPNLKNLYKGVSYPVSRGTKMLAPLVRWDHSANWMVPVWQHKDSIGQIVRVNISNDHQEYLTGHNIDGRVLMPATGYLELAWKTLAALHLKEAREFPVVIENVMFKRATVLPLKTEVQFLVNIMKQSGHFEIFEGGAVVCTGTIRTTKDVRSAFCNPDCPETVKGDYLPLYSEDIYKECHLRRYLYQGSFQGIKECDVQGRRGRIKAQENFVSFMDTMLHLTIISEPNRDILLPTTIDKVVIDPQEHLKLISGKEELPIFFNENVNVIKSGGVEISGLKSSKVARRRHVQGEPLLEAYQFTPYEINSNSADLDEWLAVAIKILLQNTQGLIKTPKVCFFPETDAEVTNEVKKIFEGQPMVEPEYVNYSKGDENTVFDCVVVTENVIEDVNIEAIGKRLSESGMVLYRGRIAKIPHGKASAIYTAVTDKEGVHLLRPNRTVSTKHPVVRVSNSTFDWLENIKNLVHTHSQEVVYLVSQREDTSGLVGLLKCLLAEPSTLKFRCVFVQDKNAPDFTLVDDFYRDQLQKGFAFNVLRNGVWGTFIHQPLKPIENRQVEDATISVSTVGDLSTLGWLQKSPHYIKPTPESEKVYVYYSALNFKDVLVSTGKLLLEQNDEPTVPELNIGLEYSGITSEGKRVMGMVGWQGLSLQVQTDPGFTWEVPKNWSLDEAASVPVVYATCYYAMLVRGRMKPGESILIHAGTGGVGIAAISIALSMGCEVFTTVGSPEKREFLKKLYPQVKDGNIGNSRNTSFRKMIMKNTNGRGVDLVLNSLAGELFQESLKCLAIGGRFLEIGKVDFVNNTSINSNIFQANVGFHGVTLDSFYFRDPRTKRIVKDLLVEGLKNGVVRPLPRKIYKEDEVEDAFRFLSSGKHKGKVMIELRRETSPTLKPPVRSISGIPNVYFNPNKSYILIGGLGGVGLELAEWLLRRGATKLVLNSRRPIHSGYQSYCLKKWSRWNGIEVKINTDDTSTTNGAKNLVTHAKTLGPVGGVFNLALVLKDGLIENQTQEMYQEVFRPKIASGFNMDAVTRRECPDLDHFIVFSSAACGRGNSGQSNYGMANSALEQLCEKRRVEGLPALAVQWGPIGEVGALVNTQMINKFSDYMEAQNISSCIESLEKFMLQDAVVGSSIILATKRDKRDKDTTRTPAEAVAHILGIRNLEMIDKTLTLAQLGLDSLMVTEIKQTLFRNYQMDMDTDEIRDLTFSKLMATTEVDQNNNDSQLPTKNGTTEQVYEALLGYEPIVEMNRPKNSSRTVFLISPIQGNVETLRPLAEQLNAVVYGIQCTETMDFDSIQGYAACYIKQMKSKQPKGPYLLCGYSFGAAVALEMGLLLEKGGEVVDIVFLDGSPTYVKVVLEDLFIKHDKSMVKSKAAILTNFASALIQIEQDKFAQQLESLSDWEKQLNYVADEICGKRRLDSDHVAISADRYYKRYWAGFSYQPQGVFGGKVLLVKGMLNQMFTSEDYGLQELCKKPVEVMKIKGDHNTILLGQNTRIISNKINSLL